MRFIIIIVLSLTLSSIIYAQSSSTGERTQTHYSYLSNHSLLPISSYTNNVVSPVVIRKQQTFDHNTWYSKENNASVFFQSNTEFSKKPGTAFAWSFFPALISSIPFLIDSNGATGGLFSAGILVGPSLGFFYAGNGGRAFQGILTRGVGLILAALATNIYAEGITDDPDSFILASTGSAFVVFTASAILITSIVVDLVGAPVHVHRQNKRNQRLSLSPGYDIYSRTPTLNLKVRF